MISKDNILLVGIGEAGGRLVSEIVTRDKRYVDFIINTSYQDIMKLPNIKNFYAIPSADGTGRKRDVARGYLKTYANTIVDKLKAFPAQDTFFFFFSFSGGSGSGITPALIKIVGKLLPQKKINIVGILPSLNESKRAKQNAIDCWNDVIQLPNVNMNFLLDNNKRETKEQINIEFADMFDAMLDISKTDVNNNASSVIDKADAEVLMSAKGSASIYFLPKNVNDTKLSVAKAIENSIFAEYSDDVCEYVGISLLSNSELNRNAIADSFNPTEDKFIEGSNSKYNLVVATGYDLGLQKYAIEMLGESINENSNTIKHESSIDELLVSVGEEKKTGIVSENQHEKNIESQKQDVDSLLDDDSFWDDI